MKSTTRFAPFGWLAWWSIATSPSFGGEILMAPIGEDFSLSPKIINGVRADRSDWPVTLQFSTDEGRHCTATVVGERVIVTAAHCVLGGNAHALLANRMFNLTCSTHWDYDNRPLKPGGLPCHLRSDSSEIAACTADVAICLTDSGKTIPFSAGKFERIKSTPPGVLVHHSIALLGYGCIVADGPISDNLYIGMPTVRRTASVEDDRNLRDFYDKFLEVGGASACNGDSGGAGFSGKNPSSREIVGLTSRGNLSSLTYLVDVLHPRIAQFLKSFSTVDVKLCGLDADAVNCVF